MYFKLGKHIFLHKAFVFLPFFMFFHGEKTFYPVMLLSAFLHEAAHLFTAICFGEKPDKFFISPYGFELRIASAAPACESAILLSGPAVSLVLALAGRFSGSADVFRANLCLFALNLLPAYPLDGGRLVKIIFWSISGVYYGNKRLKRLSFALAFLLCAAAVYFKSVWLFTVASLIFSRTKALRGTPFYKKRRRFTPVRFFRVHASVTVLELLRLFSPYYYTCVFIEETNTLLDEAGICALSECEPCAPVMRDLDIR